MALRSHFRILISVFLSILVPVTWAKAAVEQPHKLEVIASISIPDAALDVAVSGSYAYVAASEKGLLIADINNPAMPKILASVDTPGNATAVAIADNIAYVADNDGGLQIIDVSNPTAASVIASITDFGPLVNIAVAGSHAYAADITGDLHIIDISSRRTPKPVGCYKVADGKSVFGVAVQFPYAYMTYGNPTLFPNTGELSVVDVSNPSSPQPVSLLLTRRLGRDIKLSGGYAFIASNDLEKGGLEIIDVSDPGLPKPVGYVNCPLIAAGVEIKGNHAYLAGGNVLVVNVSDPSLPHIIHLIEVQGSACGVALGEGHVIVASHDKWTNRGKSGGMQVLGQSAAALLPVSPVFANPEPGSSALAGVHYIPTSSTFSPVAVCGNILCATKAGTNGNVLQVLDVSGSSLPAVPASLELPGEAKDIAIWKKHALVAGDRLYVIDISDPARPVLVRAVEDIEGTYAIRVSGSYAYVVNGAGLRILPLESRAPAEIVGSVDTPYSARDVAVSGNYAYIADGAGLQIVDVSNRRKPKLAGSLVYEWAMATRIAVEGRFAYLADKSGVITIIDIGDAFAPVVVARKQLAGPIGAMAVSRSHLYVPVCGESRVLEVLDITDPQNARIIARMGAPRTTFYGGSVAISDSKVFIADAGAGVLMGSLPGSSQDRGCIEGSTSALSTSCEWGLSAEMEFELSNSGVGPLSYFISSDADWLQIRPFMGGLQEKGRALITASLLRYALPEGHHTGKVIIADPAAENSPSVIDVAVDVTPPTYQVINVKPAFLSLKNIKPGTTATITLTSEGPFKVLETSASYKWILVEKDSEQESLEHVITVIVNDSGFHANFGGSIIIATDNPAHKKIVVTFSISFAKE